MGERLKETFIMESKENLQKCLDYLSQLRKVTDGELILQSLLMLADNLCEPALLVELPAVFEVAYKFRQLVVSLPRSSQISAENFQKMEYFCHVMRSILSADVGGSSLTEKEILAHDLKSPLGIIKSTVENMLLSPGEHAVALQRILRQANKGLQLLAHWLDDDANHSAAQERQNFAVLSVAEACCESWQEIAAKKQLQITTHVDVKLTVWAHALYLSQILQNLVGNAIKFSTAGGRIEIHAQKSQLPGTLAPAVLFQVKDQGRGIDEQLLPFIFLKKTQAHPDDRKQGSGLGLAICKYLCEWHGGTIWVKSRPSQGSTFSFVIPDESES